MINPLDGTQLFVKLPEYTMKHDDRLDIYYLTDLYSFLIKLRAITPDAVDANIL
jgi:hypothetical protein